MNNRKKKYPGAVDSNSVINPLSIATKIFDQYVSMINTKKKNNNIVDKVVFTTTIKVNVVFARSTVGK